MFKIGPILSYKISSKLNYELSLKYVGFMGDVDVEILSNSAYGFKNGLFYSWKKIEIGANIFVGKINDGYKVDENGGYSFWRWSAYNSFVIVKIP